MAIVRFAMRQKTHLAALRVRDDVLVLQTLLWSDEVRDAQFDKLKASVKISDKELALSQQLVESFSGDFEPQEFVDEYQVQLRELIARKAESGTDVQETDVDDSSSDDDTGGEVIDLMEALRRSVDRSRSAKKAGSGSASSSSKKADTDAEDQDSEEPKPKTTRRKAQSTSTSSSSSSPTGSKSPARKSPAKKAPSKTTAAKESTSAKKTPAARKSASKAS
jgi:DNA end-binding protein Ku